MPSRAPERQVEESRVVMTEIVLPEDTNHRGSIFGGRVLALIDKCAAVAAIRHARGEVLTISMDTVEFRNPVVAGQILILNGWINAAFGSSMEAEVEVRSEDPASGARALTTRAYVTMVAVDDNGRPRRVPRLLAMDDEELRRAEEATKRRKIRLQNATSS
ncbi:MAG: acyl-CoA thioesterase [Acidobacteria bacterium]|uniref:Acyl-CoA thioesterase n=1 Tax=Candidatus Polarisedimenticola svalbardensis TaxID=2886004 RepID=A0A8J7CEJ6_9BACT|nr:acyl-CoA thioesterase [Candidatus Polarisedimenticola svalbardensis]